MDELELGVDELVEFGEPPMLLLLLLLPLPLNGWFVGLDEEVEEEDDEENSAVDNMALQMHWIWSIEYRILVAAECWLLAD